LTFQNQNVLPLFTLMSSDKELPCGHKPVAKESQRQTALEADRNWLQ